ncbi:ferredoxin reductase [soil metagenome]
MATAPHGVDRYLEQVRPTWVGHEVRARVLAIRPEAPDVVTLTLRPGRGWAGAQAGQHVRVGVEVDGRRRTRSFSLASSAVRDDGCVEITVKAHADGVVSRHLVDRVGPGTTLTLSPPAGDFTLPAIRPRRLLLISGGSGITPVMAMLRTLLDEGHDGPVTFLHYARTEADVIFADELAAIDRAHPSVDVRIVMTGSTEAGSDRSGDRTSTALQGRFRADHVAALVPDLAEVEAFACGPVGMVDAVLDHWSDAGATERLHVERFALAPVPAAADEVGGAVSFAASDTTVTSDGAVLLVQAEAAGLSPANGCRMGICHTCTRSKLNGVVRDLRTGALSSTDEEHIQICVSVPVGDVAVDL